MKTEIVNAGMGYVLKVQWDNGDEAIIPLSSRKNALSVKYIIDYDARGGVII